MKIIDSDDWINLDSDTGRVTFGRRTTAFFRSFGVLEVSLERFGGLLRLICDNPRVMCEVSATIDAAKAAIVLLDTLKSQARMGCPDEWKDPPADYHAAKFDQGKPDPTSDLALTLDSDFMSKVRDAAEAMSPDYGADWSDLLEGIGHPHASLGVAEAMHYGFQKYGAWGGWREVPDALRRYTAAALRHFLFEKYYPEDRETGIDSESGIHHLSLAACNMAFVIELGADS